MRRPSPPPEWEGNMEEEEEEEGEEEEMDFRRQQAEVSSDIVELVDTSLCLSLCSPNIVLNFFFFKTTDGADNTDVTDEKMSLEAVVIKMTLMTLIPGKRSKF